MRHALIVPVFTTTLFLSAMLLFSVQPMFSKMVLPLLGGTPNVWNTAMLFFQVCLLGGYAYAHGVTRFLSFKVQGVLHICLLLLFTVALPFVIPESWEPPKNEDPTFWQISVMLSTVGGPFFILAGSAPLLQRWFSLSDHAHSENPYFLYGASNLGSMIALFTYPFITEPLLTLPQQAYSWMFGYFALVALFVSALLFVWHIVRLTPDDSAPASGPAGNITWFDRASWLFLAFVPSSLMLGVTTFLTTDIASLPLIWIIPLGLYVGTFILVFAKKPFLSNTTVAICFEVSFSVLLVLLILCAGMLLNPFFLVPLHLALFFFSALLCHTALADKKPHSTHLTEFFLIMSLGGALGGVFNALVAPRIFVNTIEYGLVLAILPLIRVHESTGKTFQFLFSVLLAPFFEKSLHPLFTKKTLFAMGILIGIPAIIFLAPQDKQNITFFFSGTLLFLMFLSINSERWIYTLITVFILTFFPPGVWSSAHSKIVMQSRNFFGTLKVLEDTSDHKTTILLNGTTLHGQQPLDPQYRLERTSYYSTLSPLQDAFSYLDTKNAPQQIGAVGLGVGTVACFAHPDRHFDFFEINPETKKIAENKAYFTYLSDCKSPYDIVLGDARLTIQKQPDERYDLILLDAFSSDNVPIHIITEEAVKIYLKKLKTDGFLVFHISNRYLDLEPVLAQIAKNLNIPARGKATSGGTLGASNISVAPSSYIIFTRSPEKLAYLKSKGWDPARFRDGVKGWTDQYSNLFSIFGTNTLQARLKEKTDAQKAKEKAEGSPPKTSTSPP